MEGREAVNLASGEYPVYPGHPLVIAYEIMSVFPDPEAALKPCTGEGLNCPEAVADHRISGGRGEVYAACDLLRLARQGKNAEELAQWADARWIRGNAGGHQNAVQPGLAQAARLREKFQSKLASWLNQPTGASNAENA